MSIVNLVDCPRCGGQGNIPAYKHIEGGRCFMCHGARKVREERFERHTRPSSAATNWNERLELRDVSPQDAARIYERMNRLGVLDSERALTLMPATLPVDDVTAVLDDIINKRLFA